MKKIMLIGDSIRQGYDKYVRLAFEGVAQVYYPKENCRFSTYVVRQLLEWKNEAGCGDDLDLIHWNAGLWDILTMVDKKNLVSLETYAENVERICNIIKTIYPKAKMVFATSTPVQEELFTGAYKRFNKDTERYNERAAEIVRAHGGIINDLYSLLKDCPKEYYSDLTHLYTEGATKIITEQVIGVIGDVLEIKGKKLDYSQFFSKKDDVTGI